jgi:thiol-disulfide isomerase/thioredoxin
MHKRHFRFGSPWVRGAFLCYSIAGSGCATSGAEESVEHSERAKKAPGGEVRVGEPLPGIVVHTLRGKAIDLGSMDGKVVMLDIWASWCAPCKEELPLLDDMAARLKDKGIEIIAVSIDEQKDAAESFLSARPRWTLTVAYDPKGKVPELLQPPKMPTSYLIDSQGVVRYINAGFERADAKKIEARLLTLAAKSS